MVIYRLLYRFPPFKSFYVPIYLSTFFSGKNGKGLENLIWLILKYVLNLRKAFSKYVYRVKIKKRSFSSLKTSTINKKKNVINYLCIYVYIIL